MSVGDALFMVGVLIVTAVNVRIGYRWSRLQHNPWEDSRFMGGTFSGETPGWYPASMTIDQINARGRERIFFSIFGAVAFAVIVFIAT